MLLHIINKSPSNCSAFNDALPFINENDTVLLIDDGVYASITNHAAITEPKEKQCRIAAIKEDLEIRGLAIENTHIENITMKEFVKLSFNCKKTISWY